MWELNNTTNKKIDIFKLGDLMDAAIVNIASNKYISKLSLQKGIFFYLLSLSHREGYNFMEIANLIGFEPYKLGPFSEFVDGEIETLEGYGYISVDKHNSTVLIKSNKKGLYNFKLDKNNMEIIKNVKFLVETLDPMEITFFIYFNPNIYSSEDGGIRNFFTSNSEIKDKLEAKKEYYVKQLLKKKVIDENTANLILYGNN